MITFTGNYPCRVDGKGRLLFPAGLKRQMGTNAQERFVVRKDIFNKCLDIYPWEEWEIQIKKLRSRLNPYNREHDNFLIEFHKGTADISFDTSGRILIPKWLLDWAGIGSGDITLVGQDSRIQLWASNVYEGRTMSEDEFASLAEKLLGNQTFPEEDK